MWDCLPDTLGGALLHRMGTTGEQMVDADVAALVEMALPHFADGPLAADPVRPTMTWSGAMRRRKTGVRFVSSV